ncbi:hypothetical protein NO2_0519 [Candidatus Termititenax persephonae]|uniref:Uncharacterized protein n=1 Tax=Candidatus Termititenax persephonae TaxID=2218525 RepID=A0A388TFR8_9BACT|nr:hypothetical protein NO2_0519 [Candidatus Termititenax persephonae]
MPNEAKVLITFLGGNDIKNFSTDGGAIAQLCNGQFPQGQLRKIIIFVTKEYLQDYENKGLGDYYRKYAEIQYVPLPTIDDPTNARQIIKALAQSIRDINEDSQMKNCQKYVNLTSGAPAILAVLSLVTSTGFLQNAQPIYSPNPQYSAKKSITEGVLDAYTSMSAYIMLKHFIEKSNYQAMSDFLSQNDFAKDIITKEFRELVEFAKNRICGDFNEAQKSYHGQWTEEIKYKKPADNFERAYEYYLSAGVANRNRDKSSVILKLGVVRESLQRFMAEKLLAKKFGGNGYSDLLTTDGIVFDERKIKNNKQLDEWLNQIDWHSKKLVSTEIDNKIWRILIKNDDKLNNINDFLEGLESLRNARNNLAHTIGELKINGTWWKDIENIFENAKQFFGLKTDLNYSVYSNHIDVALKKELNKWMDVFTQNN